MVNKRRGGFEHLVIYFIYGNKSSINNVAYSKASVKFQTMKTSLDRPELHFMVGANVESTIYVLIVSCYYMKTDILAELNFQLADDKLLLPCHYLNRCAHASKYLRTTLYIREIVRLYAICSNIGLN